MATCDTLLQAGLDAAYCSAHEVGIIYGNDSVAEATMAGLDKFREYKSTVACGAI